ncbi:MAG: DUF4251 domain-containing protein [Bacteroidales bacterium]|nr:DUF4251 domain-containing protein [Bacteroidales bacterium]
MKTLIVSLLAILSMVSPDDKANLEAIRNRDVKISVNTIIPSGMPSQVVTDEYTITIKDGKVKADLPYMGTANTAIIPGVDETGMVFNDCPIEIEENDKKADKGEYLWRFKAMCGNETVDVNITLMTNGSATIICSPANRSVITYYGSFGEE